jgi:hypothetical protein
MARCHDARRWRRRERLEDELQSVIANVTPAGILAEQHRRCNPEKA